MTLTLSETEQFVDQNVWAEWDGWNVFLYRPHPAAYMRKTGAFYNGQWCLRQAVEPNSEGKYVIGKHSTRRITV